MTPNETMEIIPPGTIIFDPDPIHRVTLMFPDEASAVLFFEVLCHAGKAIPADAPDQAS